MAFELTENVRNENNGKVQHLEHFQQPFVAVSPGSQEFAEHTGIAGVPARTAQVLAESYLREVAPIYGIEEAMLPGNGGGASLTDQRIAPAPSPGHSTLELAEEKEVMGTTVVSYQQKYDDLPVWEAGVSVSIQPEPMRVTASQSSVRTDVELPEDPPEGGRYGPGDITPGVLKSLLGVRTGGTPTVNARRQLVYQYDPDQRFDPETRTTPSEKLEAAPPTLPLPPVPDAVSPEQYYRVTEVLFSLPVTGHPSLNWRAFVETTTGAVLYLRALTACATGLIYRTDPLTAGAPTAPPTGPAATLNPFRSAAVLEGLSDGDPQHLRGTFVEVVDTALPFVGPPTATNPPATFFFDAPAREFAAVNAYHHCDWLFRHLQGMGFKLESYFDGTDFPVPVDACGFRDDINARAPGNVTGTGSGGFEFGLAGSPFPAVSIAADLRVVLHEFGHTILWDSVHSPNFGFAHSAGDSLAAVYMDPESSLRTDPVLRFQTFPWILPHRNHGRAVTDGWAWGGQNDKGGYSSEQILSTTHFRLYQSLGGDSADVNRRKLAARQTMYLIFKAVGSLASSPVIPTPDPKVFVTALMNADIGTADFEGHRGGTFHKVIRWSFEKQGLYQPPGAPAPVTKPGAPPDVDVYIDDGRGGEYGFQPSHWECTDIWNRLAPSAGGGGGVHETPVVGQVNHAYVRVRNRGTKPADNVVVRGYSADPGVGLSWPGDWKPMDTAQIAVPGGIPPGGSTVVGPFRWRPGTVGHECMFMEVSAAGDLSNIDPGTFFPCAAGPTAEWRLVPFDNNLAQRNVAPVPGGGGLRGLLSGFVNRSFTVRNPLSGEARITLKAELPPFLADRDWRIRVSGRSDSPFALGLAPGAERKVTVSLRPGQDFTRDEVLNAGSALSIRVTASADGVTFGGMTYRLDPDLTVAPNETAGGVQLSPDDPAVDAMIEDARLHEAEASGAIGEETPAAPGSAAAAIRRTEESAMDGDVDHVIAQLGSSDALRDRVRRIKWREVDIEMGAPRGRHSGSGGSTQ
ncbi:hypothetical protein [Streptomyces aurantiogriseus]|uniref:FTP domain-containing protein n=1 Tax=Streptomyces aurantiogriseus TaxID=66870 RepID=A0A918CE90_9ACTN|nr:hypothetical protein [Streptomyces aurantiogriseus]GGR19193.1 hypothetical protein GCM10010251_39220 [Streptomyces aurantiogriseus]